MTAYCFFDVREVTDPVKLGQYKDGVLATVQQYGGRYLLLGGNCERVEGSWQPITPVLIQFPSLAQAHRWYNSTEYEPLKALRLAATEGDAVFMESVPSEFVQEN
ncbi:DUF1330 domain-containing protein [Candidatus Leptofilum sp.]|uniref:DUF1330 domain-containing protein n=1 Tax=Candidatus Leptofilum sp. TaxID=3241576 RepID=UPI003B5B1199